MGKAKKTKNKFNYDKNRKKAWKKSKQMPHIKCKPIKEAWDEKESVEKNMERMGLTLDPNVSVGKEKGKEKKLSDKHHVTEELEAEASLPEKKTLKYSEPEVKFCTYMMDKYGEDYKKMVRDQKNYYQLTPKQIKKKILTFKNIPEQYNAYLQSKQSSTEMDTA